MKKNIINLLLTTLLLTFISTLINNFYFYKHIESQSKYEIRNTARLIQSFSYDCMSEIHDRNSCIIKLQKIIRNLKVPYGQHIILKDRKGKKILLNENSVATIKRGEITLSEDKVAVSLVNLKQFDATLDIIKHVKPNILKTVWNSLTFSLPKVYSKYKQENFESATIYFKTVAWPRSRPAVWFFLFSFILVFLSSSIIERMKDAHRRKEELEKRKYEQEINKITDGYEKEVKKREIELIRRQQKVNQLQQKLLAQYKNNNIELSKNHQKLKKNMLLLIEKYRLLKQENNEVLSNAESIETLKDINEKEYKNTIKQTEKELEKAQQEESRTKRELELLKQLWKTDLSWAERLEIERRITGKKNQTPTVMHQAFTTFEELLNKTFNSSHNAGKTKTLGEKVECFIKENKITDKEKIRSMYEIVKIRNNYIHKGLYPKNAKHLGVLLNLLDELGFPPTPLKNIARNKNKLIQQKNHKLKCPVTI